MRRAAGTVGFTLAIVECDQGEMLRKDRERIEHHPQIVALPDVIAGLAGEPARERLVVLEHARRNPFAERPVTLHPGRAAVLHGFDLETIERQGQVEPGGDAQRRADFVEQDVGTARAAGDAERHAFLRRHFLAQRLFDHGARRGLRFRGSREPHLFRWPVGAVDHMPGEEHDPRQSLLRGRHLSRGGERLVHDTERRRHIVRQASRATRRFRCSGARRKPRKGRS